MTFETKMQESFLKNYKVLFTKLFTHLSVLVELLTNTEKNNNQ